jgi:hypothetical protein
MPARFILTGSCAKLQAGLCLNRDAILGIVLIAARISLHLKGNYGMKLTTITGMLLIIVPIAFNVTFLLLGKAFEYPDILRKPTDYILRQFKAGGAPLRRLWYAFTFSAVLFTVVPVMVQQVFQPNVPWFLAVGTVIGVLASAVQFLGLIRWPFLVTTLADLYTQPESSQSTRDAAVVVFQAFHRYAGVAIGEHLGYLFTGVWTLLLCLAILTTGLVNPLFGWLGLLPAIGVLIGVFEETGFKAAGPINAISYLAWSFWLIAFGVALLLL